MMINNYEIKRNVLVCTFMFVGSFQIQEKPYIEDGSLAAIFYDFCIFDKYTEIGM